MKFLCYLQKGNYQIRVNVNMFGTYQLEYSDDGFRTRVRKKYKDKEQLMQILGKRFSKKELKELLDG